MPRARSASARPARRSSGFRATPRRSSRLRFALALLLIAAAVPLAWWLFLSEPQAQPLPPPIAVPDASVALDAGARITEVKLGEVTGTVQIRKGAGREWQDAKSGDVLEPNDGVRTADGSYAVLVGGETWQVKMEPGTEVGIGELRESITKLLLETGMARASPSLSTSTTQGVI